MSREFWVLSSARAFGFAWTGHGGCACGCNLIARRFRECDGTRNLRPRVGNAGDGVVSIWAAWGLMALQRSKPSLFEPRLWTMPFKENSVAVL